MWLYRDAPMTALVAPLPLRRPTCTSTGDGSWLTTSEEAGVELPESADVNRPLRDRLLLIFFRPSACCSVFTPAGAALTASTSASIEASSSHFIMCPRQASCQRWRVRGSDGLVVEVRGRTKRMSVSHPYMLEKWFSLICRCSVRPWQCSFAPSWTVAVYISRRGDAR